MASQIGQIPTHHCQVWTFYPLWKFDDAQSSLVCLSVNSNIASDRHRQSTYNFCAVILPFILLETYQYQVSTDLRDDSHSSLHRLSGEISCSSFLCIPQQCGSLGEEAELHMWLVYPIQQRWNPHEAQVCTDHSGIWEKQQRKTPQTS